MSWYADLRIVETEGVHPEIVRDRVLELSVKNEDAYIVFDSETNEPIGIADNGVWFERSKSEAE